MKKVLLVGLTLLLLGSGLFADDAKVMPMRVGRFYLAPTYGFAPGAYDSDGKYQSFDDGSLKLFNLGMALEYGIIDWITGAVQWGPGWTPWSDVSPAAPAGVKSQFPEGMAAGYPSTEAFDGDQTVNGVADLFVGAKFQIVGEKAPVQTDMFRFCIAPGVIIPLPGPNFSDEVDNALKGDKAAFSSMDNHVFGAGARVYLDWVINEHFFINLYNETIFYPVKQDLDKAGPNLAILKETILATAEDMGDLGLAGTLNGEQARAAAKTLTDDVDGQVNYKYRLTFELEPQFSTPLAEGLIFSAGLPVTYVYKPAYDYTVNNFAPIAGFVGVTDEKELLKPAGLTGEASHNLSVKPNVSLFLTKTILPLEFKFQYGIPVWGQNSNAQQAMTLQIKAYFKI